MPSRLSPYQVSAGREVIGQAIAAGLKAAYDVSQPLPNNLDTLLRRLINQETCPQAGKPPEGRA